MDDLRQKILKGYERGDVSWVELAERFYREALDLRETLLGSEHLEIAQFMENLATVYDSQGNYRAPQPLLQQAVAILRKSLGGTHPRVGELTRRIERIRAASWYDTEGA